MSSQKFRQIRFPRSKVCHMQNLGDRCNENMGRSTAMMVADSESQNFQYKNCAKSYDESEHSKKLVCLLETNNTIYMWVK